MLRFLAQPMVDIVSRAGEFKSVSTEERAVCDGVFDLANSQATAAWYREVETVIGKNCMDLVGHGRDVALYLIMRFSRILRFAAPNHETESA